jgi:ubiquinone/menaquinone biosynthesis C-methylase UbiE
MKKKYIHGENDDEQDRLLLLNRLTNNEFLNFIPIRDGDSILEVGSGLGQITSLLANQYPNSKIIGVEISKKQINSCPPKPKNLTYIHGDVCKLNFDDNSFDKVYGRYILEHLNTPIDCLKEVYRTLKPGGKVFFQENTISLMRLYPECPSFDLVWEKFIVLQKKLGGDAEIGQKLFYLLKSVGFRKVTPSYQPEIHYSEKGTLIKWIDNLIGNIRGASDDLINNELVTNSQINEAIKELIEFSNKSNSLAMFYWNRIHGVK